MHRNRPRGDAAGVKGHGDEVVGRKEDGQREGRQIKDHQQPRQAPAALPDIATTRDAAREFAAAIPHYAGEVAAAMVPICGIPMGMSRKGAPPPAMAAPMSWPAGMKPTLTPVRRHPPLRRGGGRRHGAHLRHVPALPAAHPPL